MTIMPGCAYAQWKHGQSLDSAGREAEAIPHFAAAIKINPLYQRAYLSLASALLSTEEYEKCVLAADAALDLVGESPPTMLHYLKGSACQRLGKFEQATAAYEAAIAGKYPYEETLRQRIAECRERKQSPPPASDEE